MNYTQLPLPDMPPAQEQPKPIHRPVRLAVGSAVGINGVVFKVDKITRNRVTLTIPRGATYTVANDVLIIQPSVMDTPADVVQAVTEAS